MTRRSVVALFSVCVHAIILLFAMTADLWRPITEWPTPRSAMAFDMPRPVRVDNIQAPADAGRRSPGPAAIARTSPVELAPLVAPSGVADETGGERRLSNAPAGPPAIGNPGDLDANGIAALPLPPPAPQPTAPIRQSSGVQPPQRIVNVAPAYPAIARSARVQGVVILEIVIDERGNVAKAEILRSIPLLDAAALDAVRQWKFLPTQLNGRAVPIVMSVTVNFTLQE